MLFPVTWKGYRFVGLNIVRALSLICLLLVFISNILVMVDDIEAVKAWDAAGPIEGDEDCDYIDDSTVPNQAAGAFWAVVNRLLILIQVIFLFFGEIGWPNVFFKRFLPFLSEESGLAPIGTLECLIGAQVLSHHVDTFPMVAAFMLFSIGCLNIILALIFGANAKSYRSILSWRNSVALPQTSADLSKASVLSPAMSGIGSLFSEKHDNASQESSPSGYGFGRQGEKAAGLKGFLITKPMESLPRYAPRPDGGSGFRSNSSSPTSQWRI